jgi:hypothetical protein
MNAPVMIQSFASLGCVYERGVNAHHGNLHYPPDGAGADPVSRELFDHLHPTRAVCMIHPANVPSLAVASRIGFREFGRSTYKDRPVILMAKDWGLPRP